MESLKDDVNRSFNSQVSIQASLRRNANRFACLSDGGDACAKKGGQFILYNKAEDTGSEPVSQIPPSRGINLERAGCHDFPSESCPLRVETTWRVNGAAKGCANTRSLEFAARIVLNNGSLFMDWKETFERDVKVRLSKRALCRCQGKKYANGDCVSPSATNQLAQFPRDDRDDRDEREREDNRALASTEPECSEEVSFRGESYPVSDVNDLGIGYIELEAETPDCVTADTFRFRCVKQGKGKARKASWVYLGVTRGSCSNAAGIQEDSERLPASEAELFEEETPEGEYLEE